MSSPHPPSFPEGLDLLPAPVWAHFATLCAIPRSSKGEARLRQHIMGWAYERGLDAESDAAGNLILRKPASPGYENAPGVILQAHLDMVCQKNEGVRHDFTRDPIVPRLRDGWLTAETTTLGADNGIGVALILAALEDETLAHGPLEALLTVDEEAGMGGARGLSADALQGRRLINLDTEEWGCFYIGCAGSLDIEGRRTSDGEAAPAGDHTAVRIDVRGLRGGHSGIDIHAGRGNAIKLLVRLLRRLDQTNLSFRLISLHGGTARNALPREAHARLLLPTSRLAELDACLAQAQVEFRQTLAENGDALRITRSLEEANGVGSTTNPATPQLPNPLPDQVMPLAEQRLWLASLDAAPHGIRQMSRQENPQMPSVTETSVNLGMVELGPSGGRANFMARSLIDGAADALAEEIGSLFALSDTAVELSGRTPGWQPDPASPLLAACRTAYKQGFGEDAAVCVVHAGLECGLIGGKGGKYPDMDMISFGPTIHGAHAPGERVEVASVEKSWRLLAAILAALR